MRAMAAEAEAAREARAKIIAAEGEEKASTSLRNAANIISENKGALQVGKMVTSWSCVQITKERHPGGCHKSHS